MSKAAESLLQKARDAASRNELQKASETAAAAAQIDGTRADIWRYLASLYFQLGQPAKCSEALRAALKLSPDDPNLFHDLGVSLKREGRFGEAEAMLRESWRRNPTGALGSILSLCDLLGQTPRRPEAEQILRFALERGPKNFDVLRDLTNFLIQDARYPEAAALTEQFIQRNGQSIGALEQLSVTYQCLGRLDEALDLTAATLQALPPKTLDMRIASYLSVSGRIARLDHRIRARELLMNVLDESLPDNNPERWAANDTNALRRLSFLLPYYGVADKLLMRVFQGIGDALHQRIARMPPPKIPPRGKLRVGFVSYNFSEHPIGHLLSPFFEGHAQTGAELYLYALHLNSQDPLDYAGRIRATTPHYRDCRGLTALQLAQKIRADEINILIDLDGYLGGGMPEAFAMRPAPVQIHWLQHLAGMPAPFIDYTIVDRVLVKDDERNNGNGPLIRLPDAFQCGDRVPLPETLPTRAAHGLPETGTVFCAFGNWLKIDETAFQCWLEILAAVPDSVLWLSDGPSEKSRELLRARLSEKGLVPERLIFAPRLPDKAQHIDRHRCADLFLDTFSFSAATTTTDALWAGLPVLTCPGNTAQSRLSASLLEAVGMSDTIVPDTKAYVAFATRVGLSQTQIDLLKTKLAKLLPESKLYDAGRMVAHFKDIYARVAERHKKGLAPEHMDI